MRLVVDASIAQSAGTSDVPESLYCRECLNAVRDSGHIAVFSDQLLSEWHEHASSLSRRWRKSMVARRRIERAEGEEFGELLNRACACLAKNKWREAFVKDFHMVRAALATDRTILSKETEFPKLLAIAASSIRVFSTIVYGNPAIDGDDCVAWIASGAKPEETRRIDAWGKLEED